MRPIGPRLDKYGFPIPPGFDEPRGGASTGSASYGSASNGTAAKGAAKAWSEPRFGDEPPKRSSAGRSWLRGLAKLTVVGTVIVALAIHFDVDDGIRNLLGRHHARQAWGLFSRGDLERALLQADRAVAWNPASAESLLLRAHIRNELQDFEGCLADVDALMASAEADRLAWEVRTAAMQTRINCLHRLHRHRDTAAAATDILQRGLLDRAEALNTRAYARALGDFELTEALADIDEALAQPDQAENASFLDTRGYVLFKLGRYDDALIDLNRAIELVEEQRDALERNDAIDLRMPRRELAARARRLKQIEDNLAVMYHHRGEVHEKLGNAGEATKDLFIGKKYGFDPAGGVF